MHHLIYLPQHSTANVSHLAEVGLADHAPGVQMTSLPHLQKVTDEHAGGLLCSWGARPRATELTSLTWLPAMPLEGLSAGRYLVGIDPQNPPGPEDLLRSPHYAGRHVPLGDGRYWNLPYAASLPRDILRDFETGEIVLSPQPKFRDFWMKTLELQEMFEALGPDVPLPFEEVLAFAEAALRLNYRLPPELMSWLKLFSTGPESSLAACLAVCLKTEPAGL